MNKREFLKLFGLTLLGIVSSVRGQEGGVVQPRKKRIVVIGAGLAGLAAARELQRYGHDVVIVEARERIGGRIWTSNKWVDMPLDLGATWIHGAKGNPLTKLSDEINASRLVTSYDKTATYATNGKLLSEAEEERLEGLREQIYEILAKAQNRDKDVSIRQALQPLFDKLPTSSEAAQFSNFVLSASIEQEYAGGADRLSTHWYDSAKEFTGDDLLFANGFQVITDFLAENLTIKTSQIVKEVQWQGSEVRVYTVDSVFVADQVVVTLPLGVLKENTTRFTPSLPQAKLNAISKLGMGVLNKCYLRFDRVFWPDDVDWLEYIPANHGEWTEWVSFRRAANMPILLGFNAADRATVIEGLPDQQIVASAMQTLRTIYGAKIPEPIDYQITRWASDPFARGAYSYHALGSEPAMRDTLAQSLNNRVFFAGEAVSMDYFGTAHGAFLSGIRAAQAVVKS